MHGARISLRVGIIAVAISAFLGSTIDLLGDYFGGRVDILSQWVVDVMLSDGRSYLRDEWWIATIPGIAIALTVLGFNLLGDGLRDALDPRATN